jgi:uncharacterized membrane protein
MRARVMEPEIWRKSDGKRAVAPNVDDRERWISGAAGAGMILYGAGRRGITGLGLALLGVGLLYQTATGHNPLYSAMGIRLTRTTSGRQRIEVIKSMTINRPPDELYRYWRDVRNFPRFMTHLESVSMLDEKRSHWKAKGPAGMTVEWDAEIVNEKENALIAWESCEGSDVQHWGVIRFVPAPGDRGTEVTVELEYRPVAGSFGVAVAKLFGEEPGQQLEEDLRRFKYIMETGEVPTTTGQPRGR